MAPALRKNSARAWENYALEPRSFKNIEDNNLWSLANWLEVASHDSNIDIPMEISAEWINESIDKLKKKKESTNELACESLDLVVLSTRLGLKKESIRCLLLTAQHTLGYGHRKDTSFSEVYEAIESCSEHGIGDIKNWIKRIAPFTNDIFEFSEREIRHLPGKFINLLASHCPERLVDEFDYHLHHQNWLVAPSILAKFVEIFDPDNPADCAFVRSQTSHESMIALKKRVGENPKIQSLYEEQCNLLGNIPLAPRQRTSNSALNDSEIDLTVESYPPNKLTKLNKELISRKAIFSDKFIDQWIEYWTQKDQGLNILEAFEQLYTNDADFPRYFSRNLDTVFTLCHKLQGASKAYKWAVRSIKINYHWSRWSGTQSKLMLEKYARIYKNKWKKLFLDTTKGEAKALRGDEWVIVPTSDLVFFLNAANQHELACTITETMVTALEKEISHLPLSPIHWYKEPIPVSKVSANLILHYYQWPDRLARLRAANEIAQLLESDSDFRSMYLNHIRSLKFEIEVTDFLSILFLVDEQIFEFKELSSSINYPSILSDEILRQLGYHEINNGNLSTYHSNISADDYTISESFKKSRNGQSPIYYDLINNIRDKTGYPLDKYMALEWDNIRTRAEIRLFNPYDFCGDQFYLQDKIACSLSPHIESVVLSAYLRSLAYTVDKLNVPYNTIRKLACKALPFTGTYTAINPTPKPANWPVIPNVEKDAALPNKTNLTKFLSQLLVGGEITLKASGPIIRDVAGVSCDLDVSVVYSEDKLTQSSEEVYLSLENPEDYANGAIEITDTHYFSDFGRWETNLLFRGYFSPKFVVGEECSASDTSVVIDTNGVRYITGGLLNASWKYWIDQWYPAFLSDLGPPLGTQLNCSKEILRDLIAGSGGYYYLVGKLAVLDKRNYSSEDHVLEHYSLIQIDNELP